MSFLFRSKFFLPIAIAAVVIMLLSIVYALVPKGDDTSSISDDSETSQQQAENEEALEPGEDGVIVGETPPEDTGDENQYYSDDEAEAEGYTHEADPIVDEEEAGVDEDDGNSNPWIPSCPFGQVGTPGNCRIPLPVVPNPPVIPGVTLKSSQPFNPAKVYVLTANTKVVNIPAGSNAGPTIYMKGTKFDIVEQREYTNGKKFLLVKSQTAHGSKYGFAAESMKPYVAPAPNPAPTGPTIKKVLVFMMENKTYANARANMPYTMSLVNQTGVVYTNSWSAGEWKSLPNYIALAGGSNFGIKSNDAKQINARSIFGLSVANQKSTKSYTEDQSKNCVKHKHNPWTYFTQDAASCKQFNLPFKGNFQADVAAGKLPKVGYVSPNAINNGHDSNARKADDFFKKQMQFIMQSPDWKSGSLAVIMTYDEAQLRNQPNKPGRILTTLYHPALKSVKNRSINTYIQHYSITRLWAEVAGVWVNNPSISVRSLKAPGNTNVTKATSMTSQLGLTPDPR